MDCSLPSSSTHGILQARILEWVAISFSRGSSWLRDQTPVSHTSSRLFTLWATREALISSNESHSFQTGSIHQVAEGPVFREGALEEHQWLSSGVGWTENTHCRNFAQGWWLVVSVVKSCLTLVTPWTVARRLLCPWDSPGKNTGVGFHSLLQGIFPTQESNPGLLPCRQSLCWLSYSLS